MLEYPIPDVTQVSLERVLKALGDPTRLMVVRMLADGNPRPKAEVWGQLTTTRATCSHHFRMLREAGLIVYEVHGRTHDVRLRKSEVDEKFPGLLQAVTGVPELSD